MHLRTLDFLADPHDAASLTLHTFEGRDQSTRDGVLLNTQSGRWYVVEDGIPTLFMDALRPDDSRFVRRYKGRLEALGCEIKPGAPLVHAETAATAMDLTRVESERRARDEQAQDYDQMLSLKALGLVEVPAYRNALSLDVSSPLLEAGAGTGRFTDIFAAIAPVVVSVDMSRGSLLRNRVRHTGRTRHPVHYVHADLTHLPLRTHSFGRCAHVGVYEHIPSRALRLQFLEHARRALVPGGQLLLSAYRYNGLMKLVEKEGEHEGGIPFFRFTAEELQAEVAEYFSIETFQENLGVYMSMVVARGR